MSAVPKGTLFDHAGVAKARAALMDAIRCPGTGAEVADDVDRFAGRVICPDCATPVGVVVAEGVTRVGLHSRPKRVTR